MKYNEKQVKRFMKRIVFQHIECDMVMCTELAEEAANEFGIYGDIPELFYDIAFEVATEVEESQDQSEE